MSTNSLIDPTTLIIDFTIEYSISVGINYLDGKLIPGYSGQIVLIKILSGKLAVNTTSAKTDYELTNTNGTIQTRKLNNQTNWRFCFKILVNKYYEEIVYEITHKMSFDYFPKYFQLRLNGIKIFKKLYRGVGNISIKYNH